MKTIRVQWHTAFYAALQIELGDERYGLQIETEHLLGKKPMQMDLLIIKKDKDKKIRKNIGRIFRTHNIIEYKSPDDYISINDFYKVYAYACFYQADTEKVGEIDPKEMTITFAVNSYPHKMLKHIQKTRGITAKKREQGIYDLVGDPIPMQLIITKELSKEENYWLQSMRNDLQPGGEIQTLIEKYEKKKNNSLYQAVMNVVLRANWEKVEEEKSMCEALRELFAEELQEARELGLSYGMEQGLEQGLVQGLEQGINVLIETCREFSLSREDTFLKVMKKFHLCRENAERYMEKYWD